MAQWGGRKASSRSAYFEARDHRTSTGLAFAELSQRIVVIGCLAATGDEEAMPLHRWSGYLITFTCFFDRPAGRPGR